MSSAARSRALALVFASVGVFSMVASARDALASANPGPRLLDANGVWNALPEPGRSAHSVVLDPLDDRLILFGGTDPVTRNDLWWMPADGSTGWAALAVAAGAKPSARKHHSAVWDPVRERMLVFGGDAPLSNEVWALTFDGMPAWHLLLPIGTPPSPRSRHAAIYDPVRDRMLVFGGNDGGPLNDVWELTLSDTPAWSLLSPPGAQPAARYFHSAIYDPVRDRAVIYGGQADDDLTIVFDDAWALPLSGTPDWYGIFPDGPPRPGRTMHGAAYDASHDGMVVFGGESPDAATMELEFPMGPEWVTIPTPAELDIAITRSDVVVDPARHRMILSGGEPSMDLIRRQHETWKLDLASRTWTELGPEPPTARRGHTLVYDPADRRLILHGGLGAYDLTPDTWTLDLGGSQWWTPLVATGTPPAQVYHSAIAAPSRNSMLVFGGNGTSDVWELGLSGSPAWSVLATAGTPPSPRSFHTAVYDAARDRMIVFGGGPINNEVWSLALSGTPTWTQLAPAGTPPIARYSHVAVFDPAGDRMIVFSGRTSPGTITNDVWQLSFSPTPAWTQLAPSGTPPNARENAAAAWDPIGNRMLTFGNGANQSDVWALGMTGSPAWTKLVQAGDRPVGRQYSAAAFDLEGNRFVIFGGYWNNGVEAPYYLGDTWALAFDNAASAPERPIAARASLRHAFPNPASRSATIAFTLPSAGHARLALYDLAGRKVRTLRDGWVEAGAHSHVWDLATDGGARVAPGVYLCELAIGGDRLARKVVVAE